VTWSEAIAIDYNLIGVYNFSHTKDKTNDHTLVPRVSVDSCPQPFTYTHPAMNEEPEMYRCIGHSLITPHPNPRLIRSRFGAAYANWITLPKNQHVVYTKKCSRAQLQS
jgi:hypothetical protein